MKKEIKTVLEGVLNYITSDGNEFENFCDNPSKYHVYYQANLLEEKLLGLDVDWQEINNILDGK